MVVGLLVAVGAIASITFATQSEAAVSRDCSSNSIIKCGVTSMSELRNKYNKSSELRKLFSHFGMTSGQINGQSGKVRNGIVHYDGRVTVDGKTVATGAQSVGRNANQGGKAFTVGGKKYYQGPTSQRFVKGANLAAYVVYDSKGNFVAAIIKACGNPVKATPPKPPAPKPTYACKNLTAQAIKSTDGKTNKVTFKASGSAANGAKIVGYTYSFGDGTSFTTTKDQHTHTYKKAGTYKATVHVKVRVNGKDVKVTGKDCAVTVKVSIPEPKKIQVCDLTTYKVITIEEKAFDSKKHSKNLADCELVNVCDLTTNKIVTVNKEEAKKDRYTTDLNKCKKVEACDTTTNEVVSVYPSQIDGVRYTTDLDQCVPVEVCDTETNTVVEVSKKEAEDDRYTTDLSQCELVEVCDTTTNKVVTVTKREAEDERYTTDLSKCELVEVCDTKTNQIVKVYPSQIDEDRYTTDLNKCAEKPVTPEEPVVVDELPQTGVADALLSLLGAGSLIAATSYYVASRRA